MTVEEITGALLRLLDDFESVVTENGALTVVLESGVPSTAGQRPLKQQVADLLADIRSGAAPNPVHARFDNLRQQIRRAIKDQALAELTNLIAGAKNLVN